MKNIHDYEDIISLPHPTSKKHPPMSRQNRAAQFAPFAALSGHKEAVIETGRMTEHKKLLDEHQKAHLDDVWKDVQGQLADHPLVRVTYFQADQRKSGGCYVTITKRVKRMDEIYHMLIFEDRTIVSIEDISDIELLLDQ